MVEDTGIYPVTSRIWTLLTDILCCYQDLTKMLAIAKALQLEAVRRRASVLSCLVFRPMANFVMCMHTNCYFQLLI